MYSLSFKILNQYSVSLASLRATCILFIKSACDWACSTSLTKAPMDVPLRNTCFDKTNSRCYCVKNLNALTILNAKV